MWQLRAACRDMDSRSFFPHGQVTKTVKRACENCEVSGECLEHALKTQPPGFWGGTTEEERRWIRSQKRGAS